MKKPKIKCNRIQCKKCKDVIESKYRWNYVQCKCGAVAADGGHDYLRRVGYQDDYIELSEFEDDNPQDDK